MNINFLMYNYRKVTKNDVRINISHKYLGETLKCYTCNNKDYVKNPCSLEEAPSNETCRSPIFKCIMLVCNGKMIYNPDTEKPVY